MKEKIAQQAKEIVDMNKEFLALKLTMAGFKSENEDLKATVESLNMALNLAIELNEQLTEPKSEFEYDDNQWTSASGVSGSTRGWETKGCKPKGQRTKLYVKAASTAGSTSGLNDKDYSNIPEAELQGRCKWFLKGHCRHGDTCKFLHQLKVREKWKLCSFFQKGYCQDGKKCNFLHQK
jgi:hypothetical protein